MKKVLYTLPLAALMLGGCAQTGAEFRPHVDRPSANYEADLQQCQDLAKQRGYLQGDSVGETMLGAAGGTAIGAIADGWSGAWIGALIGTGVGAVDGAYQAKDDRKNIVIKCMKGRGYNVVDRERSRTIF